MKAHATKSIAVATRDEDTALDLARSREHTNQAFAHVDTGMRVGEIEDD